jgi:uncharacterized delta-60 repeat protein
MKFLGKPRNGLVLKIAALAACLFVMSLSAPNSTQAYEHEPGVTACIVCHCPQTVSSDCSESGCHGPGAMDNCTWCHDGSQLSAPDVGFFYTSGHGKFGIDCIACHDSSIPHDGIARTYSFDSSQYDPSLSGVAYATGYRLKYVNGEVPLMIPTSYGITFSYDAQSIKANAFRLCFNCHDSSKILDNTPGDGIDSNFKARLPNPPRDYSYAWGSGADTNEHASHIMNYIGTFADSDWDATTTGQNDSNGLDSLLTCSSCHNVHGAAGTHGSTNDPMIRDGSLTGRSGYGFSYVVEDVGAGGYPMVTSVGASQSTSVGAVFRNNTADMCGGSMCHGNPGPPPASSYDASGSSWGTYIEYYRLWEHYISLPELALTYGGSGWDRADSVRQTADGGYVVSGYTDSFGTTGHGWVLKLNPDGAVAWENTYGGPAGGGAVCIDKTFNQGSPDGYIVAGGPVDGDFEVLRLNLDGTKAWHNLYGGDGVDTVYSIQQTHDGGYVVSGYTNSFDNPDEGHGWILRLNADGTIDWEYSYGGPAGMGARSIQETFDQQGIPNGYIVANGPSGPSSIYGEIGVLRLTSNGTRVWQKLYNTGDGAGHTKCVRQTSDGGYIVAGTTNFETGTDNFWVFKLTSDGTVVWSKTYGGTGVDTAHSVRETADDGYVVVGSTRSFGAGNEDFWILKLNPNGTVGWQKTYGGSGVDIAYSVDQTSDGGYVVAGSTTSFGAGNEDSLVLKLDENGEVPDCSIMGTSTASVSDELPAVADITWWAPFETSAVVSGVGWSPESTSAQISDACSASAFPIIDSIGNRICYPAEKIRIKGSGFAQTQDASLVHIANMTFDKDSPRIKYWSDTLITIKIPNYKCTWFKGRDYKNPKVWVTVGGVDSNTRRLKVLKPATCP